MKVVIVSMRFNPGHFSHLAATYRLFKEEGCTPLLLVHPKFNDMAAAEGMDCVNDLHALRRLGPIGGAVFWFPSIYNIFLILMLRVLHRAHSVYVFHEPIASFREFRRAGFDGRRLLRIFLVSTVSAVICALVDHIILPSRRAEQAYRARYLPLNRSYSVVPLIFSDESTGGGCFAARTLIAYIGTIAPDHAFDRFLEFMEQAVTKGWLQDYQFAVATGSPLSLEQAELLGRPTISARVVVEAGKPLSNAAINCYFARSAVIWSLYRRATQSGVIPKAYMFGTPVLAARGVTDEYVRERETGRILEYDADNEEILKAMTEITQHAFRYYEKCREYFLATFHHRNGTEGFMKGMKIHE